VSPFVIFDGTGSRRIKDVLIRPGANKVDDQEVLDRVRELDKPWLRVEESRDQEKPAPPPEPEPELEAPEEPYERFQGRDGLWYYLRPSGAGQPASQSDGYESEEDAEAAIEADREEAERVASADDVDGAPEAGPLLPSELTESEFECRDPDCTKTFKSTGARRNHERIFHRTLTQHSG